MESLMTMSQGGSGHAVAGAIGGALLWAIAASLVGQVYLLGLSLVYLRVTEGLDLTASEEALRATFDDAKRRTAELGAKARQATKRDSSAAGAGAGAAGATAAGSANAPPPAYGAPPAFKAAPAPPFEPSASDPYRLHAGEQTTLPPSGLHTARDPDIALPFDDLPAPAPPGPSDWAPLPAQTPSAAPLPAAAPPPPATTCPQCLSPVASEDTFCGVCGYRLSSATLDPLRQRCRRLSRPWMNSTSTPPARLQRNGAARAIEGRPHAGCHATWQGVPAAGRGSARRRCWRMKGRGGDRAARGARRRQPTRAA
jgi:hypothetical protein